MQQIAVTPYYRIGLDKAKNRVYLAILGFWRSPQEVSTYLEDLDRTMLLIKRGFTLLVDLSEMKAHPQALNAVHVKAQQLMINKGLAQTAEVTVNSIVQFQTDLLSKQSAMPLRQFNTRKEAEAYLDSFTAQVPVTK
jgi:hypothetical protein